jgi:hypothetical protein
MPSFLELLGEAMQMQAEMPVEHRRVFEARTIALFQMLADRGFKGRCHADLAMAIEFRRRSRVSSKPA